MKNKFTSISPEYPLLYCKTQENYKAYKRMPVRLKLAWLESHMEFFHEAMPAKAKKIRERLRKGEF